MSALPRDELIAALAVVLGADLVDIRDDTPLASLGADAFALLLWADAVEAAHPGVRVDADALASAVTVSGLRASTSVTMGAGSGRSPGQGDAGGTR